MDLHDECLDRTPGLIPVYCPETFNKSVTIKINAGLYARIDALAQLYNVSFNDAASDLLIDGTLAVYDLLGDENKTQFEALTVKWFQSFIKGYSRGEKGYEENEHAFFFAKSGLGA